MRRHNILIISVLLTLIIFLFLYLYVFNIYEVEISVNPKELFADSQSTVEIKVVPINSFGKRVLFRNVPAKFIFIKGKALITVIKDDPINGELIIRAKNTPGIVEVEVKSDKSLLPAMITITINPNYAEVNNFQ